jgi:hypothetical protein
MRTNSWRRRWTKAWCPRSDALPEPQQQPRDAKECRRDAEMGRECRTYSLYT